MKESTRRAREQRKHDEKLALILGITLEEVQANREKEDRDDKAREVQAVHLFLERPDAFIEKFCDECQGLFMTTYRFVSLCSSQCRIASLEKMGIVWNPMHTATERWSRAQIPTEYSIPPAALKILLSLAESQQFVEPSELSPNTGQSNNDPQESPGVVLLSSGEAVVEDYLY